MFRGIPRSGPLILALIVLYVNGNLLVSLKTKFDLTSHLTSHVNFFSFTSSQTCSTMTPSVFSPLNRMRKNSPKKAFNRKIMEETRGRGDPSFRMDWLMSHTQRRICRRNKVHITKNNTRQTETTLTETPTCIHTYTHAHCDLSHKPVPQL